MTSIALSERDVPIQALRPVLTTENLAVGAASAAAVNAVASGTSVIRLIASVDCYINLNASAASDGSAGFYLAPNQFEYILVQAGDTINVIQGSLGAGFLNIAHCE